MFPRRSSSIKYIIAIIIGAVFYCEWFVYRIQPLFWRQLECLENDTTCMKILFIADPQIQGDRAVPAPLNTLFNWDSDKFVKSTYSVVMNFFKPDVLVYLGDLMDEGSISNDIEFESYVRRLNNIFYRDQPIVQVFVPGDNDIGGENEPIKKHKIEAFNFAFNQPPVIRHRNASFYKVNGITNTYPPPIKDDENFKIVVSHYAITIRSVFGQLVNTEIKPDIYFCAHEHKSRYVRQNKELKNRETERIDYKTLEITFDQDIIYEIFVPTCSYRMGTSSIGYGAAVLDNRNQRMRYQVFWSPTRFPYLCVYLLILILLLPYQILYCFKVMFKRNNNNYRKIHDKVPLLDRV